MTTQELIKVLEGYSINEYVLYKATNKKCIICIIEEVLSIDINEPILNEYQPYHLKVRDVIDNTQVYAKIDHVVKLQQKQQELATLLYGNRN